MTEMTKEEFASMISGRQLGAELSRDEEEIAKNNGIVIVFGYSDDNMEFRGAIHDEVGCYNGGTAYILGKELFENKCDDEDCPYAIEKRAKCKTIEAVWCGRDTTAAWSYKTDIPHAKFLIYEDNDLYCEGIVFSLNDLRAED